jgi:hypothetical protein
VGRPFLAAAGLPAGVAALKSASADRIARPTHRQHSNRWNTYFLAIPWRRQRTRRILLETVDRSLPGFVVEALIGDLGQPLARLTVHVAQAGEVP